MYTIGTQSTHQIYQYKLVLLGDTAVGKTSIVVRFSKGTYNEFEESTIGAAFSTQEVQLDNCTVKFEIWDTAGQERYHTLAPMYYKGAAAAIVVYDITQDTSFERAQQWIAEIREQCPDDVIIALAGNKLDMGEERQVSNEEASKYCDDKNLLFIETSAKTNVNVRELFAMVAKAVPKREQEDSGNDAFIIKPDESFGIDQTKSKCACDLL